MSLLKHYETIGMVCYIRYHKKKKAIYILGQRVHNTTFWNANDLDTWRCPAVQQHTIMELLMLLRSNENARDLTFRFINRNDGCSTWGTSTNRTVISSLLQFADFTCLLSSDIHLLLIFLFAEIFNSKKRLACCLAHPGFFTGFQP